MIDLKKIEERCKDATPGPWDYETPSGEGAHVFCSSAGDDSDREPPTLIMTDPQSAGDVAFIQEARTDLPALVDWVKRAAPHLQQHLSVLEHNVFDVESSECKPLLDDLKQLLSELEPA